MTTKDFVYLGLIVLTAVVFFCHGFFSGVSRSRRIYEALLGSADERPAADDRPSAPHWDAGISLPLPRRGSEIRGDFGNN